MGRARTICRVEPVQKKWLSSKEAQNYLGCGDDYLRRIRERGEVVFCQDGRKTWYDIASIDRFMKRIRVN